MPLLAHNLYPMMLVSEDIELYARAHTTPEPTLLEQLAQQTYAQVPLPGMLSGHIQGRLLAMVSKMIRPQRILEIGTYTGYSALCLAEGLASGGTLHTIDVRPDHLDIAQAYFARAGLADRIQTHCGDALSILECLDLVFDLVFLDADKKQYPHYYPLILSRLRPGGYLMADNVLWRGQVTALSVCRRAKAETFTRTHAVHAFNELVQQDSAVENVLMPMRDGLMIVRKR